MDRLADGSDMDRWDAEPFAPSAPVAAPGRVPQLPLWGAVRNSPALRKMFRTFFPASTIADS